MSWKREPEFLVDLRWLTAKEGGRVAGPPRLTRDPDSEYFGVWVESEERAWSFFVHPADPSEPATRYEALRPFADNRAPPMVVGQEFVIYEGKQQVARGRIVRVLR